MCCTTYELEQVDTQTPTDKSMPQWMEHIASRVSMGDVTLTLSVLLLSLWLVLTLHRLATQMEAVAPAIASCGLGLPPATTLW